MKTLLFYVTPSPYGLCYTWQRTTRRGSQHLYGSCQQQEAVTLHTQEAVWMVSRDPGLNQHPARGNISTSLISGTLPPPALLPLQCSTSLPTILLSSGPYPPVACYASVVLLAFPICSFLSYLLATPDSPQGEPISCLIAKSTLETEHQSHFLPRG
jgi:hypothetical protein